MFSVGWKAIQITDTTGASTSAATRRAPTVQGSGRGRRRTPVFGRGAWSCEGAVLLAILPHP